mmetsp:Transcript_15806/g.31896  ORF Transcript_15806/g.31896 Transcript_15806/m.31896 type:complete len:81 (-) Transcript_15806:66-308(-)
MTSFLLAEGLSLLEVVRLPTPTGVNQIVLRHLNEQLDESSLSNESGLSRAQLKAVYDARRFIWHHGAIHITLGIQSYFCC